MVARRGDRAAASGADQAAARPGLRRGGRRTWPPLACSPAPIIGIFVLRGIAHLHLVVLHELGRATAWCSTCARRCSARLVRFPATYFDDHSSGALLSKVAYDVAGVTGAATTVLTVVVKDSIAIVGLLGWLLYLNWKLTLIALAIGAADRAVRCGCISRRLRAHVARRAARDGRPGARAAGDHRVPQGGQGVRRPGLRGAALRARRRRRCAASTCAPTSPAALTTPDHPHASPRWRCRSSSTSRMQESLANRTTVGEFAAVPHRDADAARAAQAPHRDQQRRCSAASPPPRACSA